MTTSTGLTGIIPGRGIGRLDIVANASGEYSRTPVIHRFGNEPAVVMPAAGELSARHR
jgi:hypothetical protein